MRTLLLAAVLVARPALLSAKQPPPIVTTAPSEGAAPTPPQPSEDAVPLTAGEVAPFDGVLLTETKLVHYLRLDIELVASKLENEAKDKALDSLQLKLEEKFAKQERQGWLESIDGRAGLGFGFATGIVVTFFLVRSLDNN